MLVVVVLVATIGRVPSTGTGGGTNAAKTPAAAKHLVGRFVNWVPVDEANGYAFITITNNGTTTATAECSVSVSNDFGNFGFDSLVGEEIGPGETFSGKMAISVGKGSFLINEGKVEDC